MPAALLPANEFTSFQLSQSRVTAFGGGDRGGDARMFHPPPPELALKSPCMQTGFSMAIVSPQETPEGHSPTAVRS
jgi:hypothetical protein